jgi:hypothetical protein
VIRKEEPPYEFKIHLFLDRNGEEEREDAPTTRELTLKVLEKLADFDAKNVRDSPPPPNRP